MRLSLVIPLMNEEENVFPLIDKIEQALSGIEHDIIVIDDGSTDQTLEKLLSLKKENLIVVKFSRNFGQTSALAAGIEIAVGDYIVTLDGDLQNDPSDVPILLAKIENEQLDLVIGKRSKRQDELVLRKIPSKIANYLIRKCSGIEITDIGCTLKILRADFAKNLDLYGELHRFIPFLASLEGARIKEITVKHHARIFGRSKYGIGRTLKVMSDLLLLMFFKKYQQKPMHLFGSIGICSLLLGMLIMGYLFVIKLLGGNIGHRPLFLISILGLIVGLQFVTIGFISELIMRTYYEAKQDTPYKVSKYYRAGKQVKREHIYGKD